MVVETRSADCGLPLTVAGPEDVVRGVAAESVLCQRCDPDASALADNKHHRAQAE
jgi:hypothetical protein